ncbi:hypothetical protein ABFY54_29390 [Priestia megaterium]|uniref:hypothetical protein n=1 Tax=Priestia megaterium TaxID=1404 RepID=UPI003D29E51C
MNITQLLSDKSNEERYCDTTPETISFLEEVVEKIDKNLIENHNDTMLSRLGYYAAVFHEVTDENKIVTYLGIFDLETEELEQVFTTDRFEWWSRTIEKDGSYYISNDSLTDFEDSCWVVLSELFGKISLYSAYFDYVILPNGEPYWPKDLKDELPLIQ